MVAKRVWSAIDCEKCNDWEQVYFCIDCSKFYCTHCLINENGKLGCPSGIGHRIINVEEHFEELKAKVSSELDVFKKIEDIVRETINNLKIAKSSALSLKHMKVYSYTVIENDIRLVVESVDKFFTELIENLNDLSNQYQGFISSMFRHFNNGNYLESINSSRLFLGKIRDLGNGIIKCKNASFEVAKKAESAVSHFSNIAPKLSKYLITNEFIYKVVEVSDMKNFLTILTNRRIMIIKGKKIIGDVFYEAIDRVITKKSLFFKGIEVISSNKHIKIPCTDFRCSNLINDIEYAKNINLDNLTPEIDFNDLEEKIKNYLENIDSMRKKLKNGIVNLITTHTKRLLSRFYYTGLENQRATKRNNFNEVTNLIETREFIKKNRVDNSVIVNKNIDTLLNNPRTTIFGGNSYGEHVERNSLIKEKEGIGKSNEIARDVIFKHKDQNNRGDSLEKLLSHLRAIDKMKERVDRDFRDGLISPSLFYKIYSQLIEKEENIKAMLKKYYPDKTYF